MVSQPLEDGGAISVRNFGLHDYEVSQIQKIIISKLVHVFPQGFRACSRFWCIEQRDLLRAARTEHVNEYFLLI
jgi:hypothetical protein